MGGIFIFILVAVFIFVLLMEKAPVRRTSSCWPGCEVLFTVLWEVIPGVCKFLQVEFCCTSVN